MLPIASLLGAVSCLLMGVRGRSCDFYYIVFIGLLCVAEMRQESDFAVRSLAGVGPLLLVAGTFSSKRARTAVHSSILLACCVAAFAAGSGLALAVGIVHLASVAAGYPGGLVAGSALALAESIGAAHFSRSAPSPAGVAGVFFIAAVACGLVAALRVRTAVDISAVHATLALFALAWTYFWYGWTEAAPLALARAAVVLFAPAHVLEVDLVAPLAPHPHSHIALPADRSPVARAARDAATSALRWLRANRPEWSRTVANELEGVDRPGSVAAYTVRCALYPPLSAYARGSRVALAALVVACWAALAALPTAYAAGLLPHALVPLPFKVFLTLFTAVLLPAYLWEYGTLNLLYFCDVSLLLTVAAAWLESPILASSQAVAMVLPQLLWCMDFVSIATIGTEVCGLAAYMFRPTIPLWLRALSSFHGWIPFALVYLAWCTGYHPDAFLVHALSAAPLCLVSYVLSPVPPANLALPININNVFGLSSEHAQGKIHRLGYLAVFVAALCVVVFASSHYALAAILPGVRTTATA